MPDHAYHAPAFGVSPLVAEILDVLAEEEPHGASTVHVAWALGLERDGARVQDVLEELVASGVLDRRGVGQGSIYTLGTLA